MHTHTHTYTLTHIYILFIWNKLQLRPGVASQSANLLVSMQVTSLNLMSRCLYEGYLNLVCGEMIAKEQSFCWAENRKIPLHHLWIECKQRSVSDISDVGQIVTQLHCRIYPTWGSEGVNFFFPSFWIIDVNLENSEWYWCNLFLVCNAKKHQCIASIKKLNRKKR